MDAKKQRSRFVPPRFDECSKMPYFNDVRKSCAQEERGFVWHLHGGLGSDRSRAKARRGYIQPEEEASARGSFQELDHV